MNIKSLLGFSLLLVLVVVAVLAPLVSPHDPTAQDLANRNVPPWFVGGSSENVFGTDSLGRDVLSRVIYGSRLSLLIGIASVIGGGIVGIPVGLIAGYFGGVVDDVVMRVVDIQMTVPFLVLALAVIAVLGPGLLNIILVLALTQWVFYARVVRGQVLIVREMLYIRAAQAIGASSMQIVVWHVLPAVAAPILVVATIEVGRMILAEAGLSFLGLGVPTSLISWGQIAADGRDYLTTAWWITTTAGMAIFFTVIAINFVGDWLVDRNN
jgi:peptide/nickel transport system permease protein